MHCNIIQVSFDPIPAEETLNESMILCEHNWFVGAIADCVNDITEAQRIGAIEVLGLCYPAVFTIGVNANGNFLIIKSKEEWFKSAWEAFKHQFGATCSLDKFMSYREADDKFCTYIYADGELMTIHDFVRGCAVNERYYIGGIVDYKA